MSISPNTQAILLLTARFAANENGAHKPLTPTEWGRFAAWLWDQKLTPEHLMKAGAKEALESWSDKAISVDRLLALLDRGSALALAVEKWLRAGLWIMSRADADYPARLKKRLGAQSPAILFGCGNRSLLNGGGLAVVGSRKASAEDLEFTRSVGKLAAEQGYSIISGGARGVDEASMLGSLEHEGTTVGMMADSLMRACTSTKYRPHLMNNNLALVSPFHPEARFFVGNAMARNKYIYCLSDAALVVHSGKKGGTITGAMENLKKGWVHVWVKPTKDNNAGNSSIVDEGGKWLSDNAKNFQVQSLLNPDWVVGGHQSSQASTLPDSSRTQVSAKASSPEQSNPDLGSAQIHDKSSLYQLFLKEVSSFCTHSAKTPDEIAETLELHKTQVNAWLKRAADENRVHKLSRPVRYEWADQKQDGLFN